MFCASASLEGLPSSGVVPSAASPASTLVKEAMLEGAKADASSRGKNTDF